MFTSRSLAYQDEQQFNLTVIAHDLGNPRLESNVSVIIYVNDLSNVLPPLMIEPAEVALVKGTPANTLVPVNISAGFGDFNFSIVGKCEKVLNQSVDEN